MCLVCFARRNRSGRFCFFFSSRRRHTRWNCDWSSDVCSSDLLRHKLIDGIEVRGERISYYSSLQAKLSGAPPVRVYENWCSISLDTQMGDYVLDDKPRR